MPTTKSIILYSTTRLEFGRDDEYVWWRKKYIGSDKSERWQTWVSNLKRVASSPKNFVLANNMYDLEYIKFFTGIQAEYIPSWCGGTLRQLAQIRYSPSRSEWVLTPYRLNLAYEVETIPTSDWPEPGNTSHAEDLSHSIFDEYHKLGEVKHFKILTISEAFGTRKYKDVGDFRRFKGTVFVPYQSSTMFFFELYRACVPILAPSMRLLTEWVATHRLLWEVSYGNPAIMTANASNMPNPNRFDAFSRSQWMPYYDLYQTDVFPHIIYFDDWKEAEVKVKNLDLKTVSDAMCSHNTKEYIRIEEKWKEIFLTLQSHEGD